MTSTPYTAAVFVPNYASLLCDAPGQVNSRHRKSLLPILEAGRFGELICQAVPQGTDYLLRSDPVTTLGVWLQAKLR